MQKMIVLKMSFGAFLALSSFTSGAQASALVMSDFFHDWKLNAQTSDAQCPGELHGMPGYDVPGVMGVPGHSFDSSKSVRFEAKEKTFRTISIEPAFSSSAEGNVSVGLTATQLKVTDHVRRFVIAKSEKTETFALAANKDLVYMSQGRGSAITCSYENTHAALVGKQEVGASLFVNGKKVDQCQFVAATPTALENGFVYYNEKCTFGRYAKRTLIDGATRVLSVDLVKNARATHDLEIVRSSNKLNAGSENYFTLDNEIAVVDSKIDDIFANASYYFISPYEASVHKIDGVNAVIQIEYGPVQ